MIASPRESGRFHFEIRRGGWVGLYSLGMLGQSLYRGEVSLPDAAMLPSRHGRNTYTMRSIVGGETRESRVTCTYPDHQDRLSLFGAVSITSSTCKWRHGLPGCAGQPHKWQHSLSMRRMRRTDWSMSFIVQSRSTL